MVDFKVFSLIAGAFAGVFAWFFLRAVHPEDAVFAVPFGIGFAILMAAILHIILRFEEKRYRQAEARFTEKPVFACEGAVYLGAEPRGARLYLFEDSVTILSLGKKPHWEYAMKLSDIQDIEYGTAQNGSIIHLIDSDDRVVSFFSRDGQQAADLLIAAMNDAKDTDDTLEKTDDNC